MSAQAPAVSSATSRATVLVTGASGLIGQAFLRQLAGRRVIRTLGRGALPDRRQLGDLAGPDHVRADIADLEAIAPAFAGVEAVVHLAAEVDPAAPFEPLLRTNVIGTYNVFEAARRAGVRRVVFASSGAVVAGWEREPAYRALLEGALPGPAPPPRLTADGPLRPAGLYGASKAWGEALARHYADAHGLSMLCVRIGRVRPEDRPMAPRDFSVWCSQRDVARLLELCLDAPPALGFDVFYALSRNASAYRDLAHARRVLGFEPLDSADAWR